MFNNADFSPWSNTKAEFLLLLTEHSKHVEVYVCKGFGLKCVCVDFVWKENLNYDDVDLKIYKNKCIFSFEAKWQKNQDI